MRISYISALKIAFNKWLIGLMLLTSTVAFSGGSVSVRAQQSPVQSTWVIRSNTPAKCIESSVARHYQSKQYNLRFDGGITVTLSRLHSKACAVKLKRCQADNFVIGYQTFSGLCKTIPQNGKAKVFPVAV